MTREGVEIGIVMKDGRISANGDSADGIIHQLPNGFSFLAAAAI